MLCVGSYLLLVSDSVLYMVQHIKRKCKTAFSSKFKATKLKADEQSVFLIFVSINQKLFSCSALYIGLQSKKKV